MTMSVRFLPVAFLALAAFAGAAIADDLQVIVGFHGKSDPGVFAKHGGAAENEVESLGIVAGRIPAGKLKHLAGEPGVAFVEERLVRQTTQDPNDPFYNYSDPTFRQSDDFAAGGFPAAWSVSTGSGVRVAVLDTGVQKDHVDIGSGATGKVKIGKNFTTGPSSDYSDKNGHGTHTAGTVGAKTNNGVGVAGAGYSCELAIGKVLGNAGGYDDWIANGILWAADKKQGNAKVISMSLGGPGLSTVLNNALNSASASGVVIVAAAGNEGKDGKDSYPGAHPACISVAAVDTTGMMASWSNFGPTVDIAATGVNITSTYTKNRVATLSGTSMACPHVAGAAALVWATNPSASAQSVRDRLINSATQLADGQPTTKDAQGNDVAGTIKLLNAGAAVAQ